MRRHSVVTDPGAYGYLFESLPRDPAELCRIVHGLVIHLNLGSLYGYSIPIEQRSEANLTTVEKMLRGIVERDDAVLTEPRPPERRLVGHCRVSAVLLCSMLRHVGRSARARAGFSAFQDGLRGDHWLVEIEDAGRWRRVDPSLDPVLLMQLDTRFDPLDLPADRFYSGIDTWRLCRKGQVNPDDFGFGHGLTGWPYIAEQAARDLCCLTGLEPAALDQWDRGNEPKVEVRFGDGRLASIATKRKTGVP